MRSQRVLLFVCAFFIALCSVQAGKRGAKKNRSIDGSAECRYEKGPWLECDTNIGMQKRILQLKNGPKNDGTNSCPVEKTIERPCKKQCKYAKGDWTECLDGSRERVDTLRSDVSSADCKPSRQITKPCKRQCSYDKSEWSRCENGSKFKTLTLISSAATKNSPDCEQSKTITKICGAANKNGKNKRMRKKSRENL